MSDSLIGTGLPIGRPAGIGEGKSRDNSKDAAVLEEMRDRFEYACQMEEENRQDYIKNVKISSSANQWDDEVKKRRGSNRPALTFNLLNLVVKQIIGDYRQNKMSIKVMPSGGPATEEAADFLAGYIRNVERASNADEAYTNALECACRGNMGYFRILPEYEADDVFDQTLRIKPVKNPLTVYCDPNAKLLTRSDAEWYFITEMMNKEEFKRLYPKTEEFGWDIVDAHSDDNNSWGDDKEIRLCEYFTKKRIEARLVAFDNGAVIQIDDDKEIDALAQIGIKPVKERTAKRINIQWRKCNGSHILEERVFKTKYIPIIPVFGEEVNIEGKTYLRSAIYYGIDGQHSYNYERSTAIENSALSVKAPWKVTQKMIEMWRSIWDNANNTPQPYLVYTHDPAVPQGPERIEPPTPSTAAMQNAQVAALDVQRTTGIFNAQIGEQSNVQSGVGLQEQQGQGQTSTFIFTDNLKTGIEYGGKILVDWAPEFLDTDRMVRIINSEDDVETQRINQKQENPLLGVTEVLNDIRVGQYDVVIIAGKAFASRRQESVKGLIEWAKAFPQQAPLAADLVIKNMDVPGGEQIAERVERSLPPNIINGPDSPEGQAATQQAQQQQQKQQALQEQMIQGKLQVEQGKNQASMAKSSADVQKAQAEVIKAKSDIEIAAIEAHNAKMETAAHILDVTRTNAGVSASTSATLPPQGAASAGGVATPLSSPAVPSRAEDVATHAEQQKRMEQMLTMLAQHAVAAHAKDQQNMQTMQHALGSVAEGHKAIAEHMKKQNEIAAAPVEALRDKTGRITGSRRKMAEQ